MATEPTPPGQKSSAGMDSQIGKAVVDARLATAAEVAACAAKQKQLADSGKVLSLTDILVKAGFVTSSQLKRLANPADDSVSGTLQQIPGYQIMQKIGAGAMASVFKAKQLSLDRIVAIKVLPKRLSEDPEFVKRFYKEGRAAAKLNHNNIVQAIDVGEYSGFHYFVMEFVDGKTVYDELAVRKVYSEEGALRVIIQMSRALEHAHAKGFIHRDVKPKNIMITRDGTAKLADMGLAREAGDAAAVVAEKGRAYGTPYYISPEQVRGVDDVDFRADIYSLGATAYHMVTGRVPFEGNTPTAIMHKHLKEQLVPPDHINSQLSTGFAEVIERMMAKDRDERYVSTADLLVDLERVARGEAPLQARSAVKNELLEDLADGEQTVGAAPSRSADSSGKPAYVNGLIGGLIAETILLIVLVVLWIIK